MYEIEGELLSGVRTSGISGTLQNFSFTKYTRICIHKNLCLKRFK